MEISRWLPKFEASAAFQHYMFATSIALDYQIEAPSSNLPPARCSRARSSGAIIVWIAPVLDNGACGLQYSLFCYAPFPTITRILKREFPVATGSILSILALVQSRHFYIIVSQYQLMSPSCGRTKFSP